MANVRQHILNETKSYTAPGLDTQRQLALAEAQVYALLAVAEAILGATGQDD